MNRTIGLIPLAMLLWFGLLPAHSVASGGTRPGQGPQPAAGRREALHLQQAAPARQLPLDSCDLIFLSTGEAMEVKLLRMTATEIHFLDCHDPNGQAFTVERKNVSRVQLANGTEIEIGATNGNEAPKQTQPPPSAEPPSLTSGQEKEPLSSVALVLSVLGFLIPGITLPALVIGIIALGRHSREPGRYINRGEALAAVIISVIQLVVALLFLALILAIFL